MYLLKGWKYRR